MKTINRHRIYIGFCMSLLALLIASIIAGMRLLFSDPQVAFPNKESLNFQASTRIEQPFVATQPGLREIGFLFDKSSLRLLGELAVRLKDAECAAVIAERNVNLLTIMDHRFVALSVPKISDSKGKQLCIEIEYRNEAQDPEKWVGTWRDGSEIYSDSFYTQDENVIRGYSLVFRPRYAKDSLSEAVSTLVERASQYKPPFFKGPYLAALAIFASALSLGLVVVLIFAKDHKE